MTTLTPDTAARLVASGYVAVVIAAYAHADKQQGEIISKHRSIGAADRKAKGSSMWAVRAL